LRFAFCVLPFAVCRAFCVLRFAFCVLPYHDISAQCSVLSADQWMSYVAQCSVVSDWSVAEWRRGEARHEALARRLATSD
jgi:hypothetical protein